MIVDWTPLEPFRFQAGGGYDSPALAHYGAFRFRFPNKTLRVIAADGEDTGWEHVSVTVGYGKKGVRAATWDEMCWLKDQFWGQDEAVIQFHPPASEYVNNHSCCLHLWKCVGQAFPLPPNLLVGIKELRVLQ